MGNLLSHVQFLDFSEALGFQIEDIIDSLDNFTVYVYAPATVTLLNGELIIIGDTTGGDNAMVRRLMPYCRTPLSWDKKNILEAYINWHHHAAPDDEMRFKVGDPDLQKPGFGFHTKDDGLYGHAGDNSAYSEIKLKDKGPGAWNDHGVYKAVLIPGARVEFYIDGTIAGIVTTNLPSGPNPLANIFDAYVGPGATDPHEMTLYGFRFYQGQ